MQSFLSHLLDHSSQVTHPARHVTPAARALKTRRRAAGAVPKTASPCTESGVKGARYMEAGA